MHGSLLVKIALEIELGLDPGRVTRYPSHWLGESVGHSTMDPMTRTSHRHLLPLQ